MKPQMLDYLFLSLGIVPMDLGTCCENAEEEERLVNHIAGISETQARNAWGAGILTLGR